MQDLATAHPTKTRRRWLVRLLGCVLVGLTGGVGTLYLRQHSMIYHPRPYDASYEGWLPVGAMEIEYALPEGHQTAFYIPGQNQVPKRLWLAFCGNGSLALDWLGILPRYPVNGDAFLLIDYPGYGKNAGYASVSSMRASIDSALKELCRRLGLKEEQLAVCTIGHSLGAAVALDFAARHHVGCVVAIAPFTTLQEEAALIVGGPLSHLLMENYDNRISLRTLAKQNPRPRVAIFHGEEDEVIPVRMSRALAREFPFVEFSPVRGGDHGSVLSIAHSQIIEAMTR